ncbi:nucleophile aminohydrolase [Paraphysoderma sedebokerense]|nr:nucleophile aminohydrolase [Paraphysoderma sedebokerense]
MLTTPQQFASTLPTSAPIEHRFSPYADNGGTTVAVAGEDYCIIAADTRQSDGYLINSRYAPKAWKLTDRAVLSGCGCFADATALVQNIQQRLEWYKHQHNKTLSTPGIAQMLSTMLYMKRFFPYYVHNVLGGVDEEGKGCVFSYDPVGSYERRPYQAAGSATELIQPFLDNQVGFKNQVGYKPDTVLLPLETALRIVKDAFTSATERDIYTGDYLEIWIVKKDGVEKVGYPLKKD